jgi:hypothetical protein
MKRLISILLVAIPLLAQTGATKGDLTGPNITTSSSALTEPDSPTVTEKITKDGHYHYEFDDPTNTWRCYLASVDVPEYARAGTIVCAKQRDVHDERKTK